MALLLMNLSSAALAKQAGEPEDFPYSISRHRTQGPMFKDWAHYQYVLHVEETGQEFALGGLFDTGEEPLWKRLGFDEDSLSLRWLEVGRLLHAQWQTLYQGTGGYQAQGDLLLLKSKEKWHEVLRHWDTYSARLSIPEFTRDRIQFEWQPEWFTLQIVRRTTRSEMFSQPEPLSVCTPIEGGRDALICMRVHVIERRWEGILADMTFAFNEGVSFLELEEEQDFPLKDVAAFLADPAASTIWCTQKTEAEYLDFFLQQHPELTPRSDAPKRLRLPHILPRFEPNPETMYSTAE